MEDKNTKTRFKPIYWIYMLLFVVGIYLVIYHGPHLWNILPLLFILLCPLMHLMHHKRHGKHKDSESEHQHNEKNDNDKHMGNH